MEREEEEIMGWFEEETMKEKVSNTLKKPASSLLVFGPLGFLGGFSMILVIPILLITAGVGLYAIMQFLPFIIAGVLFLIFYKIGQLVNIKKPYNLVVPFIVACIGFSSLFIDSLRSMAMGQIQTGVAAMGVEAQIESVAVTQVGMWFSIAFTALISLGTALYQKLKNPWPLIIGLAILFCGIAFLIDQGAAPGASLVVAAGGVSTSLFEDPILYVLAGAVAAMAVSGLWAWKKR